MAKGYIITNWTEDQGLGVQLSYPDDLVVDLDDMMRIFYAHITGAGEAGNVLVRLEKARSNVSSYFTGMESEDQFMINFIMGLVVANISTRNVRILEIMIRAEKSIYILLIMLAGASWQFSSVWWLVLALIFVCIRIVGKFAGGFTAAKLFATGYDVPYNMGLGLLSQGGISIAIIINFQQVYQQTTIHLIITVGIIAAIINELGEGTYAAKLCDDLVSYPYDDWFLPSKDELNLMYVNLKMAGIGGFYESVYWSSSEESSDNAWAQNFVDGLQSGGLAKFYSFRVRAVREF